jgi:hypothetical protein
VFGVGLLGVCGFLVLVVVLVFGVGGFCLLVSVFGLLGLCSVVVLVFLVLVGVLFFGCCVC